MRGTSVWLSLVLLALLQIAASEDVVCKKGKTKKKIVLGPGESFSFSTDGDQYAAKMKCNANYKLSKKCKEAKISCSEFDTVAKGESCKGDFLMVKIGKKKMKYCGSNAPDMTTKAKKFTLMFSSNKKKSAAGVQCTVQCNDPAPIVGTTTEGPGTTTGVPPTVGDCKCGLAKRVSRIVGGNEVDINEYPWQVGLVNRGSRPWCGGSVIADRWILTAAHCTVRERPTSLWVLLGEHDFNDASETKVIRANVKSIINHENYDSRTTDNDFALLELEEPIDFSANEHIRPVCLPDPNSGDYAGENATVTGWGTTSSGGSQSNTLQEVTVQIISNADCKNTGYTPSSITDNMICAGVNGGGKDSCQGDSGGPLISASGGDGVTPGQNYELVGVVSWGAGCANANYPGVYARVTEAMQWIGSKIGSSFNTCPRQ